MEQTKDMSGAERKAMLKAAREYNERLAANGDRWHMTDAQKREYDETLDVTGTGIMGYVTIPRIKVKLPVYHAPVTAYCRSPPDIWPAHRCPRRSDHARGGLRTHRPAVRPVADRPGRTEKGDTFAFHVLDETYTYQVDQISVVLPSEISKLNIESGADYATLITCTPYGVNSHRLLVRGHRIPNPKVPDKTQYDEPGEMTAVAAAVIGLLVFVAGCAFCGARAAMATLLDCAARVVRRGRRAPFVWCSGVVSSLAPPQSGDIASPVCGGVRLVVLGMWCVVFVWLVVRVAFQCVYLCLRACAMSGCCAGVLLRCAYG